MDHFVAHAVDAVFTVHELDDTVLRVAHGFIIGNVDRLERLYQSSLYIPRRTGLYRCIDKTLAASDRMMPVLVRFQTLDVGMLDEASCARRVVILAKHG